MAETQQGPSRPIKLDWWQRLLAALAGAPALGVGGASVVTSDNQAGSAALILLGGLAWLMALIGRVPDRIGKDGLGFDPEGPERRAIEAVLDNPGVPIEAKESVAAAYRVAVDEANERSVDDAPLEASPGSKRKTLDVRADDVLFEAALVRLLPALLPSGTTMSAVIGTAGNGLLVAVNASTANQPSDVPRLEVSIYGNAVRTSMYRVIHNNEPSRPGVSRVFVGRQRNRGQLNSWIGGRKPSFFRILVDDRNPDRSSDELRNLLDEAWQLAKAQAPRYAPDTSEPRES